MTFLALAIFIACYAHLWFQVGRLRLDQTDHAARIEANRREIEKLCRTVERGREGWNL